MSQSFGEAHKYFTLSAANGNPRALMWLRACLLDEVVCIGEVLPDLDRTALGVDPALLDEDAAEALKAMAEAREVEGGGGRLPEVLKHAGLVLPGFE